MVLMFGWLRLLSLKTRKIVADAISVIARAEKLSILVLLDACAIVYTLTISSFVYTNHTRVGVLREARDQGHRSFKKFLWII